MKAKKVLKTVLVIVLLLVTSIGCFFLGRFSYKKSIEKDNSIAESNEKFDSKKTYELNETIKTNLFEICVKDISFNDTICTMQYHKAEEGHEEFLKAIQKRDVVENDIYYEGVGNITVKSHKSDEYSKYDNDEKTASEGMTFVTIEYTIKNISSDMIDLKDYEAISQFSLIYDGEYNFVENTVTTGNQAPINFYVETQNEEGEKIWQLVNYMGSYKLNPLSEEVRVREYIMTSNVVKNEDKSLVLKKVVRNTPQEITTNDEIRVRIR